MDIATLVICIVAVLIMIVSIIVFPTIKIKKLELHTYWMAPLLGAVVLLILNYTESGNVFKALVDASSINPFEILAVFFAMVFLSGVLDEVGFFSYLAAVAVKYAKGKQITLFFILTALVAVLTIFTSNDIIIITFTPFIILFCKRSKISPLPYLFAEFVAANTFSMLLVIGNPTNIYLASSFGIDFNAYIKVMWLPTLFAGIVSTILLIIIFHKKLAITMKPEYEESKIANKPICFVALALLIACIILEAISSFINVDMWIIALASAGALLVFLIIYAIFVHPTFKVTLNSIKRLPYPIIPLLLSMFIMVILLGYHGYLQKIGNLFNNSYPILTYGFASFVSANLFNNIPMSVLFTEIIASTGIVSYKAIYASIIGSNIAAYFTPIGALAGIMWMSILKKEGVNFSFFDFIKYGFVISVPTLGAALLGLYTSFLI